MSDGSAQFTVDLTRRAAPRVVGVRLRPGVGYLLRRRPMWELVNRRVRYPAPELARQMAGAQNMDACFDALDSYLRRPCGLRPNRRVAAQTYADQSH